MCGRYAITSSPEAMRALFRYREEDRFPPRNNVAPTQPIPVVRRVQGEPRFGLMRWGLIPSWVKDRGVFSLLVNARGESVNDRPAFRHAMKRRRCLVPADGFYEWKDEGGRRRPYFVRKKGGGPIAFAGLWPASELLTVTTTQYVLKSVWEVLATPATYWIVGFLKRAEREDYYDRHTNFTPFSLQV